MTDLHCHILPGMDDGAKDTAVSLELLRREYEDGVRNIAFTSHFNSERTTVEAFTEKRQTAFEQLTAALEGQPMQFDFKLGAEVFFSPGLCELDTRALCMGDTAYLLLEPIIMGNQPALVALFRVPRLEAWPRMMLVMQATMLVAT